MKKIICAVLSLALMLFGFGCSVDSGTKPPKHDGYIIDKSFLYGMDEPLYEKGGPSEQNGFQVRGFDLDTTIDLLKMMGTKSFRFRIVKGSYEVPNGINSDALAYLKEAEQKLLSAGITQLIGQASIFPVGTAYEGAVGTVPRRNDPAYGEWLNALSDCWESLAKEFSGVKYWEMGNEFNASAFFHPSGFIPDSGSVLGEGKNGFTAPEQVAGVVDYMYYASKGIKKGNPNAIPVMPGLSPSSTGMGSINKVTPFLEDMYTSIKSGEMPFGDKKSTDNDDYFMVLGWHPYSFGYTLDEEWLNANNAAYDVAKKYGDDGKKVFFTEFGFSDMNDDFMEEKQIEFMNTAFSYCLNDMPYVESVCAFRLYECEFAASWGGQIETAFGYFTEPKNGKGFSPKKKAIELQKLFCGVGDLTKYE